MTAEEVRAEVQRLLGSGWEVVIDAMRQTPDGQVMSGLLVARGPAGVEVRVVVDRGVTHVVVRLLASKPVPFEDLAVAKGVLDLDVLLARVRGEAPEAGEMAGPVIGVTDALRHVSAWGPELAADLGDPNFVERLREIATTVAAATGFFDGPPKPEPPRRQSSFEP